MTQNENLVNRLDDFDPRVRREALRALAAQAAAPPPGTNVNMHAHSFFSFNTDGWSPSRVAWECRQGGLYAAALCDFDVLDGVEEFLDAGLLLGLRAAVHLETRVYLDAMRDVETTSPGEPGVTYIMGGGFVRAPAPGTAPANDLDAYRQRAGERNVALIGRINGLLPDMAIHYAQDAVRLTPGGNPTERHIIRAYVSKAAARFGDGDNLVAYWACVLGKDGAATQALMRDQPRFEEVVRAKLVKRGGLGYEQPSASTFPPAAAFVDWVKACDALPMITWLDGTSKGERDPVALLDCLCGLGGVTLNIIPDRNWNVSDPTDRDRRRAALAAIVAEADRRGLPINIGTEMNRQGLPLFDDLDGDVLRTYKDTFLRGAQILVGHSLLARFADHGYGSGQALAEFSDIDKRNAFFASVGALPPLTDLQAQTLRDGGPTRALTWFRDRLRALA